MAVYDRPRDRKLPPSLNRYEATLRSRDIFQNFFSSFSPCSKRISYSNLLVSYRCAVVVAKNFKWICLTFLLYFFFFRIVRSLEKF